MSVTETNVIHIVGAGLAGTALAWQLHFHGVRPILFDRNDPAAASRVAAGLITPITGKRMAISWNFATLWPAAVEFYRRVESIVGKSIFHIRPAVRLFQSAEERNAFHERAAMLAPYLVPIEPPLGESLIQPFGGFAMAPAAVLEVRAYLAVSREFFSVNEFEFDPSAVPPSSTVVLCQGFAGRDDPSFPWVKFNPTKGDILTLEIPGVVEDRTVHSAGWLARSNDGTFRAGSTYEREDLSHTPSATGRSEVEQKIRTMLGCPFSVRDHRATVRPIVRESRPVLGIHPANPRLAYFNGLGSKGSLLAPFYAGQLADAILGQGRIDDDVDVAKLPGAP